MMKMMKQTVFVVETTSKVPRFDKNLLNWEIASKVALGYKT